MNNGVNDNTELKIEATDTSNKQPAEVNEAPKVETTEENKTPGLGDNVKIAPAKPMYDENDKVIEHPPEIEPVPAKPVVEQPAPPEPGLPPQIQIRPAETGEQPPKEEPIKQPENNVVEAPKKRSFSIVPILLIVIVLLGFGLFYTSSNDNKTIQQLKYSNIVQYTNDEKVKLDINSTVVQDLYSKVATSVKEDVADNKLDDDMKRYLAYRQISTNNIYESNCNLFDQNIINNYDCNDQSFKPTAFKEETLQLELKKLFGENTKIDNGNIQLGLLCVGGYEYIGERGEYVEGHCLRNNAITFNADKKIINAYRINDEIYIEEEVNYTASKKEEIPSNLQDGIYIYKFKLDTNFNYVYISKGYRTKY